MPEVIEQAAGMAGAGVAEAAQNPALLKLILAWYGVAAEAAAETAFEFTIDGQIGARARVNPASPLKLLDRNGFVLIADSTSSVRVRIVPEPRFAALRSTRGVRLGDVVQVRGGYAVVTLGGGCGLAVPGHACAFCMGRELTEKAGELWLPDDVVDALRAAFDEGAAEFVHFRVGYFPGDDAGLEQLRPYLEAVNRHFDTMVAVTMHPPAASRSIDLTYASGVDVIAYNLEAPDADSMRRNLPGRTRFLGRERYLAALRHAARIFPSGAVWSELLLDLGPPASLAAAVDELAAIGVVPLLGVGVNSSHEALDSSGIVDLPAHLFGAVLKAGISMNWARDLSSLITPLEARYFVPDAPHLPVLIQQLARNRLGALTTRSLARLRRRLRVRRVRASFDSSRL
ncbi:MAG TPA: hypothetical protein VJN94_06950 [Candidatus Binataceae bacterium]|nr:hypothetical protein [Candidatus Binataceae bacterium]